MATKAPAAPVVSSAEAELNLATVLETIRTLFGFGRKTGTMDRGMLTDHLFSLRKAKSLLEAREKLVSEVLKAQFAKEIEALTAETPTFEFKGAHVPGFTAVKVFQMRLDTELIEQEMGADWIEAHKKETSFVQFKALKEPE